MSTTGVTYCLVLVSVVRAHASPGHKESRPTLVTRAGADGQATLECYMPYISWSSGPRHTSDRTDTRSRAASQAIAIDRHYGQCPHDNHHARIPPVPLP